MVATAELVVRVITDTSKSAGDLAASGQQYSKFGAGIRRAALPAAAALAAVGAAAIAAGNAAAEDAQQQAILATNLRNAAGATDAQVAATEDYIDKMARATGVADDSLRPAMSSLVQATRDVATAQDALGVALDVSAATGKDVTTVSAALAKAYGGSTGSLKRLIPSLDEATLASGDMDAIMAQLADTTGGAAAEAADTAAGAIARQKIAMDEAQETLGAALLPFMAKLAGILATVANAAAAHPRIFQAIAIAVAALAAAILIANAAMTIFTIVSSAAFAPVIVPILAVVAAVALLVAGIVILWQKSETFRNIVMGVWEGVKFAAKAYFEYVKAVGGLVLAFLKTAWRALEPVVTGVWEAIKTVAGAVADWVRDKWERWFPIIKAGFEDIRDKGTEAWEKIKPKIQDVIDKVSDFYNNHLKPVIEFVETHKDSIAAVFTAALGPINTLITALQTLNSWLDKVTDKGKAVKAGTDVPSPPTRISAVPVPAAATRGMAGYAVPRVRGRAARGTVTAAPVVINVTGALDPEAVARQIERILAGHHRRVGLVSP